MNAHPSLVLRDEEPDCDWSEGGVELRLTYDGELFATQERPYGQQKDKRAEHKYGLRLKFHRQLRHLWEITPCLLAGERIGPSVLLLESGSDNVRHDVESIAKRHSHYGFNFVPLVTKELDLICSPDILLLRPTVTIDSAWTGDVDNRLKTLIDALRVPEPNERWSDKTPTDDEKPFYCLLEDDKLLTKVSLETDHLLRPALTPNEVSIVVTVRVRPAEVRLDNFHFS